jgi:threonine synthase
LKKLVADGRVATEERVVLILTGHTLKDSEYTIQYHRGELLTDAEERGETAAERALHGQMRKPPIVLDADRDTILRTLDEQMAGQVQMA